MPERLRLPCGCTARIETASRTRVVETPDRSCEKQHHVPGGRIWLWELLVDPRLTSVFDGPDAWRGGQSLV